MHVALAHCYALADQHVMRSRSGSDQTAAASVSASGESPMQQSPWTQPGRGHHKHSSSSNQHQVSLLISLLIYYCESSCLHLVCAGTVLVVLLTRGCGRMPIAVMS
jgi:hypothetical protein